MILNELLESLFDLKKKGKGEYKLAFSIDKNLYILKNSLEHHKGGVYRFYAWNMKDYPTMESILSAWGSDPGSAIYNYGFLVNSFLTVDEGIELLQYRYYGMGNDGELIAGDWDAEVAAGSSKNYNKDYQDWKFEEYRINNLNTIDDTNRLIIFS